MPKIVDAGRRESGEPSPPRRSQPLPSTLFPPKIGNISHVVSPKSFQLLAVGQRRSLPGGVGHAPAASSGRRLRGGGGVSLYESKYDFTLARRAPHTHAPPLPFIISEAIPPHTPPFSARPWQRLHANFLEYRSSNHLVVVDAQTKWIEVSTMTTVLLVNWTTAAGYTDGWMRCARVPRDVYSQHRISIRREQLACYTPHGPVARFLRGIIAWIIQIGWKIA
ncbi:hypothetical protein EVAR_29284_1 [Eumeta japonica]|uniref:Uncharacterized protein n=1 Tax=Eumeta variegata TaxID=151549 RepID=A0A4C1VUQ9_EUMVA|nr:hypothetical protein EVAR_29284_1 [Eumeta japonica]